MKNRNPFIKALIVIGIVAAVVVGIVLILDIVVPTVGSNILTNMVKDQLQKNAVNLPFSFTGLSVNPLLGDVSVSGLYLPSGDAGAVDMKCRNVKVHVNPVDLIGFASNPAKSSFKTVDVYLEKPAMQMQQAGFQFACNDISIKLEGDISQAMLASLANGDVLALLGKDQKMKVEAKGMDFTFIALNLDPEIRPLLQKAFDFESADLDITTDAKTGALNVKSERFASSAFEGSIEGSLALDRNNIALSRLTDCHLSGTVKDETLKGYFLRMSKDQPGLVKMEGDKVELFVSGTLANPVLHK